MTKKWFYLALLALFVGLAACKSAPQAALDDAESELLLAAEKRDCAEEQYRAAERLLAEAHRHVEEKDYDAAERKAVAAQRLAREAREFAEANWEDCQRRIAEAERAASGEQESARSDEVRQQDERPEVADLGELVVVYFPYNSSDVEDHSKDALEKNVAWLRKHRDVRVRLEGHTDIRGTAEYNLALGQRRANFVRNYLIQRGISADRIQTLSYGEEMLVSYGVSESDHARNRRVEFVPLDGGRP